MNLEDLKPEMRRALVEALESDVSLEKWEEHQSGTSPCVKMEEFELWEQLVKLGLFTGPHDSVEIGVHAGNQFYKHRLLTPAGRLLAQALKEIEDLKKTRHGARVAFFNAADERDRLRESAQSAHQWQPIETAPKDGTVIDLWVACPEFGGRRYSDCYWGKPYHDCGEMGVYCDSCPDRDDWCEQIIGYVTGELDDYPEKVTHWMPLPSVPEVE